MRLGPLEDGQRVIIIGGGPAGSSCAIALKNLGRKLGRDIDVVLYEGTQYGPDSIKRVGVLAPPLVQTLENTLGVNFPCQLVARKIVGYYLHSGRYSIRLYMGGNLSYVAHNVALDAYLLGMASRMGRTKQLLPLAIGLCFSAFDESAASWSWAIGLRRSQDHSVPDQRIRVVIMTVPWLHYHGMRHRS